MKKIILFFLMFMIVGCYDYKELNDIDIVSSILVDYDSEYIITLEIVKSDQDNHIQKDFITGKGKSISDAIHSVKASSPKELFLEHVEVLCISKSLGEYGINDLIDYIMRDLTINNNYYVVVTDSIDDLVSKELDDSLGEEVTDLVNNVMGENDIFTIDMIERDFINKKKDIVLPYISDFNCKKIAYFKEGNLEGTISNDIYRMLLLNSDQVVFHNGDNIIHIYDSKIKYTVNKKEVIVNIYLYGRILEIDDSITLSKEDTYHKLNIEFSKSIGNEILSYFHNISSDILGINGKYYEKYGIKKDVKYTIKTDVNINKNGALFEVDYDS